MHGLWNGISGGLTISNGLEAHRPPRPYLALGLQTINSQFLVPLLPLSPQQVLALRIVLADPLQVSLHEALDVGGSSASPR